MSLTWFHDSEMATHDFALMRIVAHDTAARHCCHMLCTAGERTSGHLNREASQLNTPLYCVVANLCHDMVHSEPCPFEAGQTLKNMHFMI